MSRTYKKRQTSVSSHLQPHSLARARELDTSDFNYHRVEVKQQSLLSPVQRRGGEEEGGWKFVHAVTEER